MKKRQLYLFIHGAWHASWCWQKIAPSLLSAGHSVLTPDLPGHGSKLQPAKNITFDHYVTAMVDLVNQQSEPVTLIGHSMAGLIISQMAELIPNKIHELIFIAAYIPQHQQSLLSIAEASESRGASPLLIIDQTKREIRLKSSPELTSIFFNCCSNEDTQYALSQIQPQPLLPFTAPVTLGSHFNHAPKRAFICRQDRALILSDQLRMSQSITDNIVYLDADHAAYFSAADDLIHFLK